MQPAPLFQGRDLAFHLRDGHRARRMGQRGGEQVGAGEHRLALGEMRHRPGHRFGRRIAIVGGAVRSDGIRARRNRRFRRNAPFRRRFRPVHLRPGAPRGGLPDQRRGIEPEIRGLSFPDAAQFAPVDIALLRPRHQRGALGKTRTVRGTAETARRHRRLDLGAPGRERLDRVARHARDLEAAVGMGLLDIVAKPSQRGGKVVAVEHADQLLLQVETLVGHRAPLAVLALHHVGDYRMAVQLGIEVARGVVPEGGGDDLLVADAPHLPGLRILHAGLGRVLLDPGEGRRHGAVVGVDDAVVAAHQGGNRDGFRGREGQVAARAVQDFAVLAAAPEPCVRAVRHPAFEDRLEGFGVDRTLQAELFRPLPAQALAALCSGSSFA